eukprot:2388559-Rhodomonas_salina.2
MSGTDLAYALAHLRQPPVDILEPSLDMVQTMRCAVPYFLAPSTQVIHTAPGLRLCEQSAFLFVFCADNILRLWSRSPRKRRRLRTRGGSSINGGGSIYGGGADVWGGTKNRRTPRGARCCATAWTSSPRACSSSPRPSEPALVLLALARDTLPVHVSLYQPTPLLRGLRVLTQAVLRPGITDQFKGHSIHKSYLAVVHGSPPAESGTVSLKVDNKEAVTDWAVTERLKLSNRREITALLMHPHHGRTHQIRIHCARGLVSSAILRARYEVPSTDVAYGATVGLTHSRRPSLSAAVRRREGGRKRDGSVGGREGGREREGERVAPGCDWHRPPPPGTPWTPL